MTDTQTQQPTTHDELTPSQIVAELDRFIVGQDQAKRIVAIALRNRTRRRRLDEAMQEDVHPKNIIMMGPTGVGKTEIARRLARLVRAPFVKVEATKYTEVGYVGRDVESMVRDLVESALAMVREGMIETIRPKARRRARERLLDLLQPTRHSSAPGPDIRSDYAGGRRFVAGYGEEHQEVVEEPGADAGPTSREKLTKLLDDGHIEDREVEFEVRESSGLDSMMGMMGADQQMMGGLRDMMEKMMPQRKRLTRMKVAEARAVLEDEEIEAMLDQDKLQRQALRLAEQNGIIFIDEIDKIAGRQGGSGPDVSREGVQRDILPIVEGSAIFTKYGTVRSDHVLFIAAGAFHASKPSDLIPELQGRFPLRVELNSLDAADFERILVEPRNSLIKQYRELLAADGVELDFTDDAVAELARAAMQINEQTENIGARRLHAVMERVLEPVSFDAPDRKQGKVRIDAAYVRERLRDVMDNEDLSRFIL